MPAWLIWLILAGVLAAAEAASLTFVLLMFAGGAVAAAVTAALGGPVVLQVVTAAVATGALLGAVRPVARRHLLPDRAQVTGADALVGMPAVVLRQVDAHDGRVRLNGGEWTARSFDEDEVMGVGSRVRVVRISGATALVLPEAAVGPG